MPSAASHYRKRQVIVSCANIHKSPDATSGLETQANFGATVTLLKRMGVWHFVRLDRDGYEGYVLRRCIGPYVRIPTYGVRVPRAIVYRDASFKSGKLCELAMNSLVLTSEGRITPEGYMVRIDGLGWIFEDRLIPVDEYAADFVAVLLEFRGMLYDWGAEGSDLDCSSALQQALYTSGYFDCPRDCLPQSEQLGEEVASEYLLDYLPGSEKLSEQSLVERGYGYRNLKRGNIVFWTDLKGRHVAVMIDSEQCVHFTIAAPYRGFAIQPLADAILDQQRDGNGLPTRVRRIPGYAFE